MFCTFVYKLKISAPDMYQWEIPKWHRAVASTNGQQ